MGNCLGESHASKVAKLNKEHQKLQEAKELMELKHRNANTAIGLANMGVKLGQKEVAKDVIDTIQVSQMLPVLPEHTSMGRVYPESNR